MELASPDEVSEELAESAGGGDEASGAGADKGVSVEDGSDEVEVAEGRVVEGEEEVSGAGVDGTDSGTIVVNVLAPLTARAIQLNGTSAGAGLFRVIVKPLVFTRVTI